MNLNPHTHTHKYTHTHTQVHTHTHTTHHTPHTQAMWLMLQRDSPEDYVIATGEVHSVREFVELAFKEVGVELV